MSVAIRESARPRAMGRRPLTRPEMLAHPWWGVSCLVCAASPGEPCGVPDGKIHGQRTGASLSVYVDPRDRERVEPAEQPEAEPRAFEQLALDYALTPIPRYATQKADPVCACNTDEALAQHGTGARTR